MKVAELKGDRGLVSIECSCGATWKREPKLNMPPGTFGGDFLYKTRALQSLYKQNRDRQRFISNHGEHELKRFHVVTTLTGIPSIAITPPKEKP